MRAYLDLNLRISEDDDQLEKVFEQLGLGFDDNDATTAEECTVQRLTLAAGAADQAINFGGVSSASMMLIIARSDVSVKLNGSATAIEVRTTPAAVDGVVLSSLQRTAQPGIVLWRGAITALSLTNLSGTATAAVTVVLVGNAT